MIVLDTALLVFQYMLYGFIGFLLYKRVILPYLTRERQDQLAHELELQYCSRAAHAQLAHFYERVTFIKTIFNKFLEQRMLQEQRRVQAEVEAQQRLVHNQKELKQKNALIEQARFKAYVMNDIMPRVRTQLLQELSVDYTPEQCKTFTQTALYELARQAKHGDA